MRLWYAALGLFFALGYASCLTAAEPDETEQTRFQRFEETLSGVRLVGQFTIIGNEQGKLTEEEYTINSVEKLPEEDFWKFEARIKYGKNDYTVPLPLRVKWAGETPVVTLTDFSILGQGPFSARVLFYNGKYAGTWSHGEVGGHLFGTIVKIQDKAGGDTKSPE